MKCSIKLSRREARFSSFWFVVSLCGCGLAYLEDTPSAMHRSPSLGNQLGQVFLVVSLSFASGQKTCISHVGRLYGYFEVCHPPTDDLTAGTLGLLLRGKLFFCPI